MKFDPSAGFKFLLSFGTPCLHSLNNNTYKFYIIRMYIQHSRLFFKLHHRPVTIDPQYEYFMCVNFSNYSTDSIVQMYNNKRFLNGAWARPVGLYLSRASYKWRRKRCIVCIRKCTRTHHKSIKMNYRDVAILNWVSYMTTFWKESVKDVFAKYFISGPMYILLVNFPYISA